MVERRTAPWWLYAMPEEIDRLEANEYRRGTGAALFRAVAEPGGQTTAELVTERLRARFDNPILDEIRDLAAESTRKRQRQAERAGENAGYAQTFMGGVLGRELPPEPTPQPPGPPPVPPAAELAVVKGLSEQSYRERLNETITGRKPGEVPRPAAPVPAIFTIPLEIRRIADPKLFSGDPDVRVSSRPGAHRPVQALTPAERATAINEALRQNTPPSRRQAQQLATGTEVDPPRMSLLISGEVFLEDALGIDISGLPGAVRRVLDAVANPAVLVSAGIGGPISFGGSFARRFILEALADIGGRFAAEKAIEELPEDAHPVVRAVVGLTAGVIGGGGAAVGGIVLQRAAANLDSAIKTAAIAAADPTAATRAAGDVGFARAVVAGAADEPDIRLPKEPPEPGAGAAEPSPPISGEAAARDALPSVDAVPLDRLKTRPDLFQARDVPEGQAVDPVRVNQIARAFDPDRFDPIVVVRDPANPNDLIIVSGHHRAAALPLAVAEGRLDESALGTVPVRILEGDITDAAVRTRIEREARIANFGIAPLNLRERARAFADLEASGMTAEEIALETRSSIGMVERTLDAARLGDATLERVVANVQFEPIAEEIGRGVRVYDMSEEGAAQLFERLTREGSGATLPSRTAIRNTIDTLGTDLQQVDQGVFTGFGRLEGFEEDSLMGLVARRTELKSQLDSQRRRLSRQVTSARELASATGIEAEDLIAAGERKLADLETQIDTIDETVLRGLRNQAEAQRASTAPREAVEEGAEAAADIPAQEGAGFFDEGQPLAHELSDPEPTAVAHSRHADPDVTGGAEIPRRPTADGEALGGGRPPRRPAKDPAAVLASVVRDRVPGERLDQTLMRTHEGAIDTAKTEARVLLDDGNVLLQAAGFGRFVKGQLVVERSAEIEELFLLLRSKSRVESGELIVPNHLQDVYDDLRGLTDWEESFRLDFDPEMATVTDYFYRGWLPPKDLVDATRRGNTGTFGRTPGFKMPRVDETFEGMLELGYEPLSWNPYEQWRISRMQGIRYREQMTLIADLNAVGLSLPAVSDGPSIKGWRTPKIGPAFEGKPFATLDAAGEARPGRTRRRVVPNKLANQLENIYGISPSLGTFELRGVSIDPLKIIDALTFLPKRAVLFGSFFQQRDFLLRNLVGTFSEGVDRLRAGHPVEAVQAVLKFPPQAVRMLQSNFSPDFRQQLRRKGLSDELIIDDGTHAISRRMISEKGLSTFDRTIFRPGEGETMIREVVQESGFTRAYKAAPRLIATMERVMRQGLFEGIYPAAIWSDIETNIAPMIVREYGGGVGVTSESLAGMIAKVANIRYSTIPASQSVVQNRFMRELLTRAMFSMGEAEGLLKQAVGVASGSQKKFWAKHWIGAYVALIGTANVIHFASTGEFLPADRYIPLERTERGIFPLGYRRDYASPDIPFTGRNGAQLTLDLVGQLDTALRILSPGNFLTNRESVPVRAILDQLTGTDYYGRAIDTVGPGGIISRTANLIRNVLPFGPGNLVEAARQKFGLEGIIPEQEGRIGIGGSLLQVTGENVRAETTPTLLDRMARESGELIVGTEDAASRWAQLTRMQRERILSDNPEFAEELRARDEFAAATGNLNAVGREERRTNQEKRIAAESELNEQRESGELSARQFADAIEQAQRDEFISNEATNSALRLYQNAGELPDDPNQSAYVRWLDTWEQAQTTPNAETIDFDLRETLEAQLFAELDDAQISFIEQNRRRPHHPSVDWYFSNKTVIRDSNYYDVPQQVYDQLLADDPDFGGGYTEFKRGVARRQLGDDISEAALWRAMDARLSRLIGQRRDMLRIDNPALDEALAENFGLVRINERAGGGTTGGTSADPRARPARPGGTLVRPGRP